MPQIVVIAIGALSLYFAFRWFRAEARRVDTALKRTQGKLQKKYRAPAVTPLALDASTGIYFPVETA